MLFDPPRADAARVRRELGIADGTPLVGMVAYFYAPTTSPAVLGPRLAGRNLKGHDIFLHAIPHVLAAMPNARFALVGGGGGAAGVAYQRDVKKLRRRNRVDH